MKILLVVAAVSGIVGYFKGRSKAQLARKEDQKKHRAKLRRLKKQLKDLEQIKNRNKKQNEQIKALCAEIKKISRNNKQIK